MYHKVIPIYNGNLTVGFGEFSELEVVKAVDFNIHCFAFLIIDETGDAVVVDTGFSTDYVYGFDSTYDRSKDFSIRKAIAEYGYDTEKIKNVIMTHIHWDHTGGMHHFPEATFHVQTLDFSALLDMLPDEEIAFVPGHWEPCLSRVHLVDGEYELKPGLKMVFSGRHSQGHQIIVVDTTEGRIILGGDEMTAHKKFWENMPADYWVKLRERYFDQYYWTHDRLNIVSDWLGGRYRKPGENDKVLKMSEISKMGKTVLFSHDINLLKIKSIP